MLYYNFFPQTPWHRFADAVSADVSKVCDVVNEEERSWPGVNRRVLRMYGAKPYQSEPTYTLLSTERRKKHFYTMVISSKKFYQEFDQS